MKENQPDLLSLLIKYHATRGRYTCYPQTKYWGQTGNAEAWAKKVLQTYDEKKGVDLYLHIPFCSSLCTFCGLNIKISKNNAQIESLIAAMEEEWKGYKKLLPSIKINSIYVGGGSPSFLSTQEIAKLLDVILDGANQSETFFGTMELGPKVTEKSFLKEIRARGFTRINLGVQDFDEMVLANVNREQRFCDVKDIFSWCQEFGLSEIVLEFIFGLPLQTAQSVAATYAKVGLLRPSGLKIYPLANVPWQYEYQQGVGDFNLPSIEEKYRLYLQATALIEKMGYRNVGMNHFFDPDSDIFKARQHNALERNVTGFTVGQSQQLIGLGPSAISYVPGAYQQNVPVLEEYIFKYTVRPEKESARTYFQSESDLVLQQAFLNLICKGKSDLSSVKELYTPSLFNAVLESCGRCKMMVCFI